MTLRRLARLIFGGEEPAHPFTHPLPPPGRGPSPIEREFLSLFEITPDRPGGGAFKVSCGDRPPSVAIAPDFGEREPNTGMGMTTVCWLRPRFADRRKEEFERDAGCRS